MTLATVNRFKPRCGDCLYWSNPDDPDESCETSPQSSPDDEACDCFEPKGSGE